MRENDDLTTTIFADKAVMENNCPIEANSQLYYDSRYKSLASFGMKDFLEANNI